MSDYDRLRVHKSLVRHIKKLKNDLLKKYNINITLIEASRLLAKLLETKATVITVKRRRIKISI